MACNFTPNLFELRFAEEWTREAVPRIGLLVLLKTFQHLGYFVKMADVPGSIIRCIANAAGYPDTPHGLTEYDASTVRFRHLDLVRSWLGITAHDRTARRAMVKACVDISRVREDLADIINFAIEELVRQLYELPAFSALLRAGQKSRATVNRGYYTRIARSLDTSGKQRINEFLVFRYKLKTSARSH
jgi:histone H3/H4